MENSPQPTDLASARATAAPGGTRSGTAADYSKPVAYDTEGRPLYLHPAGQSAPTASQAAPSPNPHPHGSHQYVHVSRPISPAIPEIPPEIMTRYMQSAKRYPQLNLSKGEFIISAVKRHPIGLVEIWGVAALFIVAMAALLVSIVSDAGVIGTTGQVLSVGTLGVVLVAILVFIGAVVASYIYNNNRFYLTNESVIQEIQTGLFNKHEQTVSLANIEDASYKKTGILSYVFDYGTIRLSTEGDETTYRFSYVANPKRHIAVLNNAVEAFKNGRPVDLPHED